MGLGAGGLDTQEIRKSFFLLDFPKWEGEKGASAQPLLSQRLPGQAGAPGSRHRHRRRGSARSAP